MPISTIKLTLGAANFVPTSSDPVFTSVQRDWISPSWGPSVPVERKVTTVQLVATIARQSPQKLGPILPEVLNGMFEAVSKDDPELKEGCLQVGPSVTRESFANDPKLGYGNPCATLPN